MQPRQVLGVCRNGLNLEKGRKLSENFDFNLLVAAITTTLSFSKLPVGRPSNWIRNSVFKRRLDSWSDWLRSDNRESISSMKMMAGWSSRATANKARTIFSPSPTYLLVSDAAEILKKVAEHSVATARARRVFPLPGGPKSKSPRDGVRNPVKSSGLTAGKMTISFNACLAVSLPATSTNSTFWPPSIISAKTVCTSFCSTPLTLMAELCNGAAVWLEWGVRERGGVARPEMLAVLLGDWLGLESCRRTAGGVSVAGFLIWVTLVSARDMLRGKVWDLFISARFPGRRPDVVSFPVAEIKKFLIKKLIEQKQQTLKLENILSKNKLAKQSNF